MMNALNDLLLRIWCAQPSCWFQKRGAQLRKRPPQPQS